MTKMTLQPKDGNAIAVQLIREKQTLDATIGDKVHKATVLVQEANTGTFLLDGQRVTYYTHQKDNVLSIWVNGDIYHFELPESAGARRSGGGASAGASGNIKAPMPGTVLNIPVKEGDSVEAEQAIVVMESMKMEMTLTAPFAGKVTNIHATTGDIVEMNALLIDIEPVGE